MDIYTLCDTLSEAAFLLRENSPDSCLRKWKGVNCGLESCPFCRVNKCIEELDKAWAYLQKKDSQNNEEIEEIEEIEENKEG
jgi:hypothetical protein